MLGTEFKGWCFLSGLGWHLREGYYFIMSPKALDYESLNENVKKVQYAVRGELYLRASELQKEGKKVCILALFGCNVVIDFELLAPWFIDLVSAAVYKLFVKFVSFCSEVGGYVIF